MNRLRYYVRSIFQPWTARQRALAESRPRLSKDEFVTAIAESGGDSEAANLIWNHLEGWGLEEGFTPYPDDDLTAVFGIAEEELEADLFMTLVTHLSLPIPTTELLQNFGRVDTPRQIALLITQIRGSR